MNMLHALFRMVKKKQKNNNNQRTNSSKTRCSYTSPETRITQIDTFNNFQKQ